MLSNIKDKPPTFPLKAGLTTMARDMAKMYRGKTRCSQEMHRTQESTAGAWLVIVTEHSVTGKMMTKMDALPVIVLHDDLLSPHPPYECCTPTHRSVLVGPEGEENVVRFLPYADDASFPVKQYLKKFSRLEWEEDFDPDLEAIQLETISRLHFTHHLCIDEINRMHILDTLRISHNAGILRDAFQRDLLSWPGITNVDKDKDDLQMGQVPKRDDLPGRVTSLLRVFCPIIQCLGPFCYTHHHALPPSDFLPSKKPRITGEEMRLSEGEPCGKDCFRTVQDMERYAESLPPPSTDSSQTSFSDVLRTILGVAPDLFSCQLAVLCFKPCKEVFVERLRVFPDHAILPLDRESSIGTSDAESERDVSRRNVQTKRHKRKALATNLISDQGHLSHPMPAPCAHAGPCTTAMCSCYASKLRCHLACRCGVSCSRQWPACSCQRCDQGSCPCFLSKRECAPGICVRCDAGGRGSRLRQCSNTNMQRQASKPLEIKTGLFGLGAFATQDIAANEFIGTYVGHIMSNSAAERTGDITRHNRRNYLFEFSEDYPDEIFDAARIGNATRFLNHKGMGEDNVDARTMLINGEHQIGFFAKKKVKPGEELFLDYGEGYWTNHEHNGDEEDES